MSVRVCVCLSVLHALIAGDLREICTGLEQNLVMKKHSFKMFILQVCRTGLFYMLLFLEASVLSERPS